MMTNINKGFAFKKIFKLFVEKVQIIELIRRNFKNYEELKKYKEYKTETLNEVFYKGIIDRNGKIINNWME